MVPAGCRLKLVAIADVAAGGVLARMTGPVTRDIESAGMVAGEGKIVDWVMPGTTVEPLGADIYLDTSGE